MKKSDERVCSIRIYPDLGADIFKVIQQSTEIAKTMNLSSVLFDVNGIEVVVHQNSSVSEVFNRYLDQCGVVNK